MPRAYVRYVNASPALQSSVTIAIRLIVVEASPELITEELHWLLQSTTDLNLMNEGETT